MNCPHCNSHIEDDATFCTNCGSKIDSAVAASATASPTASATATPTASATAGPTASSPTTQPATAVPNSAPSAASTPQPQPKKKTGLIVGIVIGVLVVAFIIAFILHMTIGPGFNFGQDAEEVIETEEAIEDMEALEAEGTPEETVYEFEWGNIALPQYLDAALSVTRQSHDEENNADVRYKAADVTIANIYPDGVEYEIEAKSETYLLGNAYYSGASHPVYMTLYYIGDNNLHMHWGRNDGILGVVKYCQITPKTLAECVNLKTVDGYAPAALMDRDGNPVGDGAAGAGADAAASGAGGEAGAGGGAAGAGAGRPSISSQSSATSPFWGIWIGASKDKAEMDRLASSAVSKGFSQAAVYVTSDWSNLNSERWYVVSAGVYSSESEANAALSKARADLTSSAYVKYTGNYIG